MFAEMVRTPSGTGFSSEFTPSMSRAPERSVRPVTPLVNEVYHFRSLARSAFVAETIEALTAGSQPTASIQDAVVAAAANDIPDPVQKARDDRMALLVRELEGKSFSREDAARIAVLTERLRRLAPRVTNEAMALAEQSVGALEQTTQRVSALRQKYGLK